MPRSAIESKNALSARVRARREELGLSRSQVIEKAGLPSLTVAKLANIEIQRSPSEAERHALEQVLGISLSETASAPAPEPSPAPPPPPVGISTPSAETPI